MDQVTVPRWLWEEILEYFENREDVRDGPDGEPQPNREMQIMNAVRQQNLGT